jgi:hypothetical protein
MAFEFFTDDSFAHLVWAERRPALAHAVMAPLICWSFSSSMFRYLLVDHAVPGDVPEPSRGEVEGGLTVRKRPSGSGDGL